MQNPDEKWQADVKGQVYDASFGELTIWIGENSLLEDDKVRRGRLRWLKAGKVPQLRDFFNAKANGTEPPFVAVTTTDASNSISESNTSINAAATIAKTFTDNDIADNKSSGDFSNDGFANDSPTPDMPERSHEILFCEIHRDLHSVYICETCSHSFCNDCIQGFGTNVNTCPYCGATCREINEYETSQDADIQYQNDMAEGFGFNDFGKALVYPLKFKPSLFFGGLFLAFLAIGQGAGVFGSPILAGAAIICYMLANAITFGVLANTIDNFARGMTTSNFMPSFDDFSVWDDVVHPFFLSIAAYISSFGLMFVLVIGMVWFSWSAVSNQMNPNANNALAAIPDSVQSKEHIDRVLEKYKTQNDGRVNLDLGEDGLTQGQRNSLDEEAEFQRVNDLANNLRKNQLESSFGKAPASVEIEQRALALKIIKAAGVFLVLIGLAAIWGIFYFPIACAVAGYTRSFTATLNPLIGIDTIKHLGFDYIKILLMYLLIGAISLIVGLTLTMILSPFNLPKFGNLPANFIGSFVSFYLYIVFSVTLGFAIYKNSGKLKLYRK